MSVAFVIFGVLVVLCVFSGANFYVARKLFQWLRLVFTRMNAKIYICIFVFFVLSMFLGVSRPFLPIPLVIKNIMAWISALWMGVFVYLLLLFLVADLVVLLGSLVRVIPSPVPGAVRFVSGLLAVLLTMSIVSYGLYNANQIRHVSYDIQTGAPELKAGMKIVMISDLHLGAANSEKNLEKVIHDIDEMGPDIVCIAGDIFNDDFSAIQNPAGVIELFKSIDATYGVYACLGNHDGGRSLGQMTRLLEESDIELLNDEYRIIDDRLVLVGRLDASPIGGFGGMKRTDIADILSSVDTDLPIVVMDHNPARIGEYGNEVGLILCGHTHRGQMFPGNLITRAVFTVDYGYYRKDAESPRVVVTSGAGYWGPPMRVGTNSEIVSINLH